MSIKRRAYCWLITLLFLGLVIFWILWLPYKSTSLYQVIPANATFVSSHTHLAERLPNLLDNKLIKSLLKIINANLTGNFTENSDAKLQSFIKDIAPEETLLAYIPALGNSGRPAWIAAFWIGNTAHQLRWALNLKKYNKLESLGTFGWRTIWRFKEPATKSGMKLTFTICEGILLGCLSQDEFALQEVLMTYEGFKPSVSDSLKSVQNLTQISLDKGWLKWRPVHSKSNDPILVTYQISSFTSNAFACEIKIHSKTKSYQPISGTIDLTLPGTLLGDLPAATLVLPLPLTRMLVASAVPWQFRHIVDRFLKDVNALWNSSYIIGAVFTGKYSGLLNLSAFLNQDFNSKKNISTLQIKIPTIMAMVKVKSANAASSFVFHILDELNAEAGKGFIIDSSPILADNYSVYTVEVTTDSSLANLPRDQRPAYAYIKNWLIFSSNAGSLIKLIECNQSEDVIHTGKWQEEIETNKLAGCLYMDLNAMAKVLRLPLMLYAGKTTSASTIIALTKAWFKDASASTKYHIRINLEANH